MNTSRYTVRRVGWFQPPHGDPYTRRMPSAEPVARFGSFDAAETYRREVEAAARAGENPFRFGGASVFFQSSLDGPRLHDWLMDAGIDPPANELRHSDWRAWWDAFAHTWSEYQLAHAWAAFDKVRFFDIAEQPTDAAHLLLLISFSRDRGTLSAATEGGQAVGAYRAADAAEAERARRERELTNGYDYRGAQWFRYGNRIGYDPADQEVHLRDATLLEVAAVPTDVPPMAALGYLVQRRAVFATRAFRRWSWRSPADARVPIAVFATRADAVAERDRLTADMQQRVNPFVFVDPALGAATEAGREALAESAPPLPLPAGDGPDDWREWFDLCQDEMTAEQRHVVWELCDAPLFEVIRVEVV